MAHDYYDDDEKEVVQRAPKKADVILKLERQISVKTNEIAGQSKLHSTQLESLRGEVRSELANLALHNSELFDAVKEDYASFRRELKFIAVQNESIYTALCEKVADLEKEVARLQGGVPVSEGGAAVDYDTLAEKVVARMPAQEVAVTAVPEYAPEIDYDTLARKVVNLLPSSATGEPDYDLFVDKIVARLPMNDNPVVYAAPVAAPAAAAPEYSTVEVKAEVDYDLLASKVAERIAAPAVAEAVPVEFDYDALADKVAERIPAQESVVATEDGSFTLDYDVLADKVAERVVIPEVQTATETVTDFDYDVLADKVAERIPANETYAAVAPVATADIDYDLLADKVVARMPVEEEISPDYIASKVAEQLVMPEVPDTLQVELDYDALADKVAERVVIPAKVDAANVEVEIDYDALADKVAERIPAAETVETDETAVTSVEIDYETLADKVAERIVIPESHTAVAAASAEIDEEDLADRIALKIGAIRTDDFDILVDDDGCESITKGITERLDYGYIAETVAEKIRDSLDLANENEPDYEDMAQRISEKITVAGVNEDAIADKAAAVLSNYLPEIDTDEIADKVASQVISSMPAATATVDTDYISSSITEKIIETQADHDYDIVLDEDGLERVTTSVSEKITATTDERFNAIERDIAEIKEMLEGGVVMREEEVAGAEAYEEQYVAEESLVTVSEVVGEEESEEEENPENPPVELEETVEEGEEAVEELEEVVEETVDEPVEEQAAEEPVQEVVEAPVVVAAQPAESEEDDDGPYEEFSYDDLEGGEGDGVDFLNMMRYNRSFIARIIQSTDDQKNYYGSVRNALLSYRKVNSNIAWGAERFHKGRETIARFKIRGKTLVLYLALDPKEHEYSVYHHKDVSDNKSVAGTPMMIKVKSPLGVKKAVRLIDEMLEARGGIKREVPERDYAAMYPFESIEELIEDGLVKDVRKDK